MKVFFEAVVTAAVVMEEVIGEVTEVTLKVVAWWLDEEAEKTEVGVERRLVEGENEETEGRADTAVSGNGPSRKVVSTRE